MTHPQKLDLRPRRDLLSRRFSSDVRRRGLRSAFLLLSDVFSVVAGLAIATWLAREVGAMGNQRWLRHIPTVLVLVVLGQMAAGTYGPIRRARNRELALQGLVYAFVGLAALGVADGDLQLGLWQSVALGIFLGAAVIGSRSLLARAVGALYARGVAVRNALVVGSGEDAREMVERFRAAGETEIRIVGHVSEPSVTDPAALGGLEDLSRVLEEYDVRSVIVSSGLDAAGLRHLVGECFVHGASVSVVPATLTEIPARVGSRSILGWPMLELNVPRLHLFQLAMKRTVDIIGALSGILLLSPVYVAVAVAVRLEGAPVLFRQRRLGLGGRAFTIYKFRSMRPDAEQALASDPRLYDTYVAHNYKFPAGGDPRISKLGRFLRRASLDELPQLFNVLVGQMSLVGPRPIVPAEIDEYGEQAITFLAVKPGLTGWWQISGRSAVGYPERANLDMDYITGWSVLLDLKILWLTLPRLFKGAH